MKKIISILLALTLALSLCTTAWADTTVTTLNELNAALASEATTITLGENIAGAVTIPAGKTVTLNLGGKTLTGDIVLKAGDLTVTNGKVAGTIWVFASDTDAPYNHLTVNGDATIEAFYAVVLYQNAPGANNFGSTVDIYGTLLGNLWVMGNIETDLTTANNPCVANVYDNATINAGDGNTGIALQGAAKVTVGKANISGGTGIEVRAGELTVNGATITGTTSPTATAPNGSGTTTDGAGIAVAQHTTKLPTSVIINSGNISGHTALYQSNPQNNEAADVNKVSVTIKDGSFAAINGGTNAAYSENKVVTVNGGAFSSDVTVDSANLIVNAPAAKIETTGGSGATYYVVGAANIASAANNGSNVTIIKGGTITGINDNVTVTIAAGAGDVTINDTLIKNSNENVNFTVKPAQQPEQPEQPDPTHTNRRYPAANTTTTPTETKKDDAISSAKTFDAGVALYVGMALTSVTGMAWVGKKRGL